MKLDLLFPVRGESLPTDHGYALYGALSVAVPEFHDPEFDLRFAPLNGQPAEAGLIRLTNHARLRVRVPEGRIRTVLTLAGRRLEVAGHHLRLGVPSVVPLRPASALSARLVTIKNAQSPEELLAAARTQLTSLGIQGEPGIPTFQEGIRAGQPKRRVIRIQGRTVVGFACLVTGLTADESIRLQESGLGGRTRMGCGFFVPVREG